MKLSERIKRTKKLVGSDIIVNTSAASFVQSGNSAKILKIEIEDIFNINLVVKSSGTIYVPEIDDDIFVDNVARIPIVNKSSGRVWYHTYECNNHSVKNIFFTENDYNSSLLKGFDENMVSELEVELEKINKNIILQQKFFNVNNSPVSIASTFTLDENTANRLFVDGLSTNGYRNIDGEMYYLNLADNKAIFDLNSLFNKKEEIVTQIGLMNLTRERIRK